MKDYNFSESIRNLGNERLRLVRAFEEMLSEASAKCDGLLRTEDAKFAFAVMHLLKETLRFMDDLDEELTSELLHLHNELDEREERVEHLNAQIQKVLDFIEDNRRLRKVEEILREA